MWANNGESTGQIEHGDSTGQIEHLLARRADRQDFLCTLKMP